MKLVSAVNSKKIGIQKKSKTGLVKKVLPLAIASVWSSVSIAQAQSVQSSSSSSKEHIDHIEQVHVVSSPLKQTQSDTALAITVLEGEALRNQAAGSLGETLSQQVGIHSASFGAGVGQPVIRGQSGNRVSVLQNNMTELDAASASPDHANSVEPLIAQRVEVIRGPATLLYGNGAIGGVVNIVDNRIPTGQHIESTVEGREALSADFEARYNSVNNLNSQVIVLDKTLGRLSVHVDASRRHAGLLSIPSAAESVFLHELHEAEEEVHEDDHLEGEQLSEDEGGHSTGKLANSDLNDWSASLGASYLFDEGYIGVSFSKISKKYGLPNGTHIHGQEGVHGEESVPGAEVGGEPGEEIGHEDEHGQEEIEKIRVAMQSKRWALKSEINVDNSVIQDFELSATRTEYEHQELEYFHHEDGHALEGVEEGHEGEDAEGPEVATEYKRTGNQLRALLRHQPFSVAQGELTGAWGVQLSSSDLVAAGEEVFIPATKKSNNAIFIVEQYAHTLLGDEWIWEAGIRVEQQDLKPSGCSQSDNTTSYSASGLWYFQEDQTLSASYSISQRAPSSEERYSNIDLTTCELKTDPETWVVHGATAQYELMADNLVNETAHNKELRWQKIAGDVRGEFTLYHSDVKDYVYLARTGEEFEEIPIAQYEQSDARFYGWEAQVTIPMLDVNHGNSSSHWDLDLFADSVTGELSGGGDLPRIPPLRVGTQLNWHSDQWAARLRVTQVEDQKEVAAHELPTKGYVLVGVEMDYHFHVPLGGKERESTLFIKGDNLLDEEIRHHSSYVKDLAPAGGRGGSIGVRFHF